ncbi:MAG TPA: 50S ribosomal protein L37e [Methanotrichaceae archaeon]|nr:50S ribosomal protein L37e [Methanotrichaceae archaeon]
MTKGTPSMGKRQKRSHIRCRRCGSISFNFKRKICVKCGFGRTAKQRLGHYKWMRKADY